MLSFVSPPPANAPVNARRLARNPTSGNFVALYKDLVSHWRMYDSEGEVIQTEDDGPARLRLVAAGPPTFAFSGQVSSYSAAFNGSTAFFGVNDTAGALNPDSSWTWRLRVKLDTLGSNQYIMSYFRTAGPGTSFDWSATTQKFNLRVSEPAGQISVASNSLLNPSAGVWYCLVGAYDKSRREITLRIYPGSYTAFNPPPLAPTDRTAGSAFGLRTGGGQLRFGTFAGQPNFFMDGNLSHALFYGRLLNAFEETNIVAADYAAFPGFVPGGMVAGSPVVPTAPSNLTNA